MVRSGVVGRVVWSKMWDLRFVEVGTKKVGGVKVVVSTPETSKKKGNLRMMVDVVIVSSRGQFPSNLIVPRLLAGVSPPHSHFSCLLPVPPAPTG